MKIETGKRYVDRDGNIVGPMELILLESGYTWRGPSSDLEEGSFDTFMKDDAFIQGAVSKYDLVAEYVEPVRLIDNGDEAPTVIHGSYEIAAFDALAEVRHTKTLWPSTFYNAHGGYAVLLEEVDELKTHVWTNQKKRDLPAMRKEAIQVAAVALRFAAEVCDEERGRR